VPQQDAVFDAAPVQPDVDAGVQREVGKALRDGGVDLGETGPLSEVVQEGRKALKIRHIRGMEVHRKRPRRFR
jgi:hypothetical protein